MAEMLLMLPENNLKYRGKRLVYLIINTILIFVGITIYQCGRTPSFTEFPYILYYLMPPAFICLLFLLSRRPFSSVGGFVVILLVLRGFSDIKCGVYPGGGAAMTEVAVLIVATMLSPLASISVLLVIKFFFEDEPQ